MATTSPFRTIGAKERLVDRVVGELERLIVSGELEPGAKLPPERELAEQIGVSRTVLREAVRILVTKGLLATKHGVGTVVQSASSDQFVESMSLLMKTQNLTLDNLHQVRVMLEVENAGMAAQLATAGDLEALQSALLALEGARDPKEIAEKDAEFHNMLALATHNPLIVILLDSIAGMLWEIRLALGKYPDLATGGLPDHRRIFNAVIAKDTGRARHAMQDHLNHARKIQETYLARESHNHRDPLSSDQPIFMLQDALGLNE
jgi:GntR family transcriptional regulator, transcriptional repressor for pyruvate dehydrogenase complex